MPEIIAYRMTSAFEIFIKSNNILVVRSIIPIFSFEHVEIAYKAINAMILNQWPLATVLDLKNIWPVSKNLNTIVNSSLKDLTNYWTLLVNDTKNMELVRTFFDVEKTSFSVKIFTDSIEAETWAHYQMIEAYYKNKI